MRKSTDNKTLCHVSGGVCAPVGFSANGARVQRIGGEAQNSFENIAMVVSKRYCTAACEFLQGGGRSACGAINKKHLQMQYARGVFLNGEIALENKGNAHILERVCFEMGKGLQVPDEEVLLATSGKIGCKIPVEPLLEGIKRMFQTASSSQNSAESAARALSSKGLAQTEAYAFHLGDYPYTIGMLCGGETATTCVLTTDVAISAEMLRKALSTAVKDTFALLQHRGEGSPNDVVCMLASGASGNYPIAQEDSEYEKFLSALTDVLHEVCQILAVEDGDKRLLLCEVKNAKSKRVSRSIAKSLVHSIRVKEMLRREDFPLEGIVSALCLSGEAFDVNSVQINIRSTQGEFMLFDRGIAIRYEATVAKRIIDGAELTVSIDCKKGNYRSIACGGF